MPITSSEVTHVLGSLATLNARSNQEDLTLKNKLINNVKRQFSAKALKLPAFYWLNLDLFLFWASNLVGLMFLPTEMKSKGYAHHQVKILQPKSFFYFYDHL